MILNSNQIQQILPHRYSFFMVDTIEEIIDENTIIGKKNVTVNEAIFSGHFPDKHVFPGVLIIEALADTGAVLLLSKDRKSTRLNSSHVRISYAVFCLKKKITNIQV